MCVCGVCACVCVCVCVCVCACVCVCVCVCACVCGVHSKNGPIRRLRRCSVVLHCTVVTRFMYSTASMASVCNKQFIERLRVINRVMCMCAQAMQSLKLYNKLPSLLWYIVQHSHVTEVGCVVNSIQATLATFCVM